MKHWDAKARNLNLKRKGRVALRMELLTQISFLGHLRLDFTSA
jgi:hypothetical protein